MKLNIRNADTLIVWIRRELRVQDHLALWSALEDARTVAPLYIIDGAFRTASRPRQLVILDGLEELKAALHSLGGRLFLRTGEPEAVIHAMLRETGAAGVYCTNESQPELRCRDQQIRSSVEAAGKLWKEFKDRTLFDEREILSKSRSEPFTVFTAYKNAWTSRQEEIPPPLPFITHVRVPDITPGEMPAVSVPAGIFREQVRPVGGEREGVRALKRFLRNGVDGYHEERDRPGNDGTSRLSHHLASGSLGIRTAYHALAEASAQARGLARQGPEAFLDELIWREFYHQILANFPHVAEGAFKPAFDRLDWPTDRSYAEAWQNGSTGYPIVDAAMRQLNTEGWMHNRCRMIVASFLTKDLHVDWRVGEGYFMRMLADGDVALNNGGWQWSAGTGNDAQPWFRIFNPTLQSKKCDPEGAYLRRYVPELARVPAKYIHEPWTMPPSVQAEAGCRIGREYPTPIVDHARERARTLELYANVVSGARSR